MAAQNVANTQKVQAVVNEKYATMTQDGYLKCGVRMIRESV